MSEIIFFEFETKIKISFINYGT